MLVQGQRSFSHEEFRGVVYSKYIQSPETMVRLHIQMARYFARLPASDRKVGGCFGRQRMLMLLLVCLDRSWDLGLARMAQANRKHRVGHSMPNSAVKPCGDRAYFEFGTKHAAGNTAVPCPVHGVVL